MTSSFDTLISRISTDSVKWETIQSEHNPLHHIRTDLFQGPDAAIPMWIADMDFAAPRPVVQALVARARHGIYGYTERSQTYDQAVVNWMKNRHNWEIQPDWIVATPGVIPALAMLVRTFLQPGDKAIIQPPVYFPFYHVLRVNQIEIVENPLRYQDGRYTMDFDDLARKARDPHTRLLILCSPHNPVGRVWSREELTRLAQICLEHDLLVISDEIHADLSFVPFTSYGALGKEIARRAIICTAASKTFNLAGLAHSNIIIPDRTLRAQFKTYLAQNALPNTNLFGRLATEVAYTHGAAWLDDLLRYLSQTLDMVEDYVTRFLSPLRMIRPEGTYLVWLDGRALGMDPSSLQRFFVERARVYLEQGAIFGPGGEGFLRMNIAMPRKLVREALRRMRIALAESVASRGD